MGFAPRLIEGGQAFDPFVGSLSKLPDWSPDPNWKYGAGFSRARLIDC